MIEPYHVITRVSREQHTIGAQQVLDRPQESSRLFDDDSRCHRHRSSRIIEGVTRACRCSVRGRFDLQRWTARFFAETPVRPREHEQHTHVAFGCPASAAFFHSAKAAALSWGTCLPCVARSGDIVMSSVTEKGRLVW